MKNEYDKMIELADNLEDLRRAKVIKDQIVELKDYKSIPTDEYDLLEDQLLYKLHHKNNLEE